MTLNKKTIIITTIKNIKQAKLLSKILLESNTCSCINIIPKIHSIYKWDNMIQSESESMLLIKSSKSNFRKIEEIIKKNHVYDLPEILSIDIDQGSKEFLKC